MLIEKDETLLKNKKIANIFNSYFDSLDLFSWSTQIDNGNTDTLQNSFKKFHNHLSLIKLSNLLMTKKKFSFSRFMFMQ